MGTDLDPEMLGRLMVFMKDLYKKLDNNKAYKITQHAKELRALSLRCN